MGHDDTDRRSLLAWAVTGLGAVFTAVLGAPVIAYLIDPRNRKGGDGDFRAVDMIPLTDLRQNVPVQGVLRSVRRDAWTLHPNDVLGRVWVVLKQPALPALPAQVAADDANVLHVFTTICPHLGCSVNQNADPLTGFTCPCHAAQYNLDGTRKDPAGNPAPRGMDTLEWKVEADPANPQRRVLLVRYQNFKAAVPGKEVI
jgi:Rieske Fe-S protein